MVEQVPSFRTFDGKKFDTAVEAHTHEIREIIKRDKPELRSSLSAIMAEAAYLANILAPLDSGPPEKVEAEKVEDNESPSTDARPVGKFTCKNAAERGAPEGWRYFHSSYGHENEVLDTFITGDKTTFCLPRRAAGWPEEVGGRSRQYVEVLVDHAPPGGNKFCDHDWIVAPVGQGLIDRCVKCGEERA